MSFRPLSYWTQLCITKGNINATIRADGSGVPRYAIAGDAMMALTKDFKDTIQARAQRDPAFRKALLQEGVECLLAGDVDTGKAVLRDYINATIGFEGLSRVFDK